MSKIALTDLSVRSLKEGTYFDSKTTDFGIRVGKNRKTWFVIRDRSRSRVKLGTYPALSLAEARKKAQHEIATHDPAEQTAIKHAFSVVLEVFLKQHYKDKRPRVQHEAQRLMNRHFLPAFKSMSLDEVTDGDIEKQLNKLESTPSEQLHAFRAARVFFKWCTRPPRRYISRSPLEGYQAPSKDRKGTRVLADPELVQVWNAGQGYFGDMVKLLILWGARNGEIGRLRRTWVEGEVLTIPGKFTKNKRDHSIPLLPMAREILDRQPNAGHYYFPGKQDGWHFNDGSWGKLKQELDTRSGVKNYQLRDIRRTFRSNMPKLGVPREIAERLVNHVAEVQTELDEIYDRYDYLPEKREALLKWEAKITELLARQ